MRTKIYTAIRITVSLVLIALLLYIMRGKYGQIVDVLKGTDLAIFAAGTFIFLVTILVCAIRLQLIAKVQSISLTFHEATSLSFIGYFFNNFLPTAIGGDVVKAYYLSKKTVDKTGSYTSIFIDRAMGLITMIFMAFIALFIVGTGIVDKSILYMIYVVTAISAIGIVFILNKNLARKFSGILSCFGPLEKQVKKAYSAIHAYRHHTMLMSQAFAISIISQLFFFASIGILALSIGSHISPINILLRMPIVSIISLLPSINGLGVREGSTVLVFGPLIGEGNALAISILVIVMLLISSLIGGLLYAFSPQFKVKLREIEKEAL